MLCYWATEYLNVKQLELAGLLNITQSAVSMAVERGSIQAEEKILLGYDEKLAPALAGSQYGR